MKKGLYEVTLVVESDTFFGLPEAIKNGDVLKMMKVAVPLNDDAVAATASAANLLAVKED